MMVQVKDGLVEWIILQIVGKLILMMLATIVAYDRRNSYAPKSSCVTLPCLSAMLTLMGLVDGDGEEQVSTESRIVVHARTTVVHALSVCLLMLLVLKLLSAGCATPKRKWRKPFGLSVLQL